MKKTLLIAAAALAASVISSQAQVYSQNIVGYANQSLLDGGPFNSVENPLSNGTNNLEQILTSLQGGENIYLWNTNGGGYYVYQFLGYNSGNDYDWVDGGGVPIPNAAPDTTVPPPAVPPGTGFFFTTPPGETNVTWVGTVLNTNAIPLIGGGAFNVVGSAIPFTGPLEYTNTDTQNTNLNAILQSGDSVYVWNTYGGGYFIYQFLGFNSGNDYDWVDGGGVPIPNAAPDTTVPPPTISVGQAFLYTTAGANTNWVQQLNIQ